ncbi:hypothetical protein L0Z42_19610 [Burkholderia multivorans]|uniref:hypothetical protein n=1 Tax=Burkholderia TaxID=32008 RepID=UPI0008A5C1C2|nr:MULTISPECIES: hypothetical protein [Burkholderia]MBJ9680691.1 hypothetical protein [Burkholderia multivorans]MCO1372711.1 hypothetical protein [Burkholderia multivorans]MCO1456032.1 hypothetical protein [Burkholderia multivorans]MCO1470581.1 hypothetical protein [Burkholderia multivorans]MDN7743232.1 hypothetical protein [Burkholderia multivorans]
MTKRIAGYGLIAACMLPVLAMAQEVTLSGKTSSTITATVAPRGTFDVTDEKGGWFDSGLEMKQLGGWDAPYEVEARLRVLSTSGTFQVRLDTPLEIRNQADTQKMFQRPSVTLAPDGGQPKSIVTGQGTTFSNPVPPVAGEDSVGYYTLAVAAYPPAGDFKATAGTYSGVLSLTFEPTIKTR